MHSASRVDQTLTFLPHRLNRQPVVVRGLTADELWACTGISAMLGLLAGLPLAWLSRSVAMVPTLMLVAVACGVFFGGGLLRRQKRGRLDAWALASSRNACRSGWRAMASFGCAADKAKRAGAGQGARAAPSS